MVSLTRFGRMKAVTILVHLMLGLKQTVAEMAVSSDEGITPRQALRMTKPKEYEEGALRRNLPTADLLQDISRESASSIMC